MKKILGLLAISAIMGFSSANAEVIGVVDFDKVVDNYNKVKIVSDEIADRYSEIERYRSDKEREFRKISTPIERKNFEEATAKELVKRQEAYIKLKERKEAEIDRQIKTAIKQVAMANHVDTVVEQSVVLFGGVDITDKVISTLNSGSIK